ncbi:MAG: nucleotidyltransferase domain-containing protein [Euryarchaeota archaeon]|nr:nucleotidyltransferase domain-containing protein [Euryarchaeota archaeon]
MDKRKFREIDNFLKKIEELYKPEKMLIFGSRARDEHLATSDYDILIVSKEFEGIHFLKRISTMFEHWGYDYDIDILPYTPKEFEKKKQEIGIVAEAVREGIEIVVR